MNSSCFTRDEAEMICYQYQSLVGKPYSSDRYSVAAIECVAVVPFDNLNKWFFIYLYEDNGDPETALSFYESEQYDVILISRIRGEITFVDIRTYMAAHHIKPDPLYFSEPNLAYKNDYNYVGKF